MARPMEIDGRVFYKPNLRWKSGRAYIRFYHPDRSPTQKDFALHTSEKDAAEYLFQTRRFEYLHGMLDPWSEKRVTGVTLGEAVAKYLAAQDVRKTSLKSKRVRLEPFARANPGMLVSGVTVDIVREYCYRKSLKTGTQQRYLAEIRHFIEYCQGQGWITSNPAAELHKSTPRRKRRENRDLTEYLSPPELRAILTKIEEDIAGTPRRAGRKVLIDVMHFAVLTGLRRGEICNLRWDDVRIYDPPKESRAGIRLYGWINVSSREGALTKTGDADRVPMVPQAHALLRSLRESKGKSGYVFESPRASGQLNAWWVSNLFRHYRREAKIRDEIHFHSLRHTCASWLAESSVDLKVIQEVMRHANIRQTRRNAHLGPEMVANKMIGAFEQIQLQ